MNSVDLNEAYNQGHTHPNFTQPGAGGGSGVFASWTNFIQFVADPGAMIYLRHYGYGLHGPATLTPQIKASTQQTPLEGLQEICS